MSELEEFVRWHVDYYRKSEERPSRRDIINDFKKDSQFAKFQADLAVNTEHPAAEKAFARLVWPIVKRHMCARTGWWSVSRGPRAAFVHEDWATPIELRDAVNCRIIERDKDQSRLDQVLQLTEQRCRRDGISFDAQYDEDGELIHVDVWEYEATAA